MGAANSSDVDRLSLPRMLEPFRRGIEATIRPCLSLQCRAAPGAVAGSRYGGVPLVPWGISWPQSPKRPMAFVGQLNFEQLARAVGGNVPLLPSRGVLALFYDVEEQRWGFDPADRDFWRVTYVPDVDQAVALVPPLPVRETFAPQGLVARVSSSLPSPGDALQARFPAGFARYLGRSYTALHAAFRRQQLGVVGTEHQVLGHAHWLDRDARGQAELVTQGSYCGDRASGAITADASNDWMLLWQIVSDEAVGFSWGDGGSLYLLIREPDLRAGQWGKAWLVLQC